MVRMIGGIAAGFVLWTVLWLGSNAGIRAAVPGAYGEDGSLRGGGLLALILVLSVVFSVASGYAATWIAGDERITAALILGIVLLAVGIFVQVQSWALLPVWYHISFLALLLPGSLAGGWLRLL